MNSPFNNSNGPFSNSQPTSNSPASTSAPTSTSTTPQSGTNAPAGNAPAGVSEIFAANQAVSAATPESLQLPTVPEYKASGRIGGSAIPLLLLSIPIAGVFIGWLNSIISQYFNLFIVSELGVGLLVGAAFYPAVRFGKCRSPKLAATAGVLAGLIAFFATHTFQAVQLRNEYLDYVETLAVQAKLPPATLRARAAQKLTPIATAQLYFEERTNSGVTLSKGSSSSSTGGINISGPWYWLLSMVELFCVAGVAGGIASELAKARYNEQLDQWYRKKSLYAVRPAHVPDLLSFALASDWKNAGALARESKTNGDVGANVIIYDCPPQTDGIVVISSTANNKTTTLFEQNVNSTDLQALRQGA